MKSAAPPTLRARPLALCVGLFTFAAAGCEAGEAVVPGLSGWRSAGAAERPWRAQAPVAAAPDVEARRLRSLEELSQWGSVSPDGRLYAAQLSNGQIGIRDLETGEIVRPLEAFAFDGPGAVQGFGPVFSPDGKRLAFASLIQPAGAATDHHGSGAFLWILDLEARTGSLASYMPGMGWLEVRDWFPDGASVVALRWGDDRVPQIVRVSVEDGSEQVLRTLAWDVYPGFMALSPDGRHLAYDVPDADSPEGPRHIVALAVDGSRQTRLVDSPTHDVVFGWTPDGSHLLFGSERAGTMGAWLLPVADGRAAGEPALVKPDLWNLRPVSLAADGRFFYAVEVSSPGVRLATLDLEEGRLVEPPDPVESTPAGRTLFPAWSPDGRRLAFATRAPGGTLSHLTVRDLPTGEVQRLELPDSVLYVGGLGWTVGGDLLFLSRRDALIRIDPRTGRTTEVYRTPTPVDEVYQIHPDPGVERVLALAWVQAQGDIRDRTLQLIDLADGSVEVVVEGRERLHTGRPALSPDGRRIAFFEWRGEPGGRDGAPDTLALVVHDLPTGEAATRDVFPVVAEAGPRFGQVWSPDGRWLLYTRPADDPERPTLRELVKVPAEGGEARSTGLVAHGLSNLSFHPDGRRLVFEAGVRAFELWVLEGLPGGVATAEANDSEEEGR